MRLDTRIAIIIYMLSLITLILNSMDRQVNVWFPKMYIHIDHLQYLSHDKTESRHWGILIVSILQYK